MSARLPPDGGFREAVLAGLHRRPRAIPCRYLYDHEGSALFEAITALPEYYLTRAETALLEARSGEVAAQVGPGARVVEFGAGSMRKTRILLSVLDRPAAYIPIDIAGEALLLSARRLAALHPGLEIVPLVADFAHAVSLPPGGGGESVLVFFPGSTIGNFTPAEARDFLRRAGRMAGRGGWLLVGVDMVKDPAVLEAAYDDAQGITAAFLRNLLARANRELGADFDPGGFDLRARWNARECRVELHLVAGRRQVARVDGHSFAFRRGDTIHVENCYKYSVEQFQWLARMAGLFLAASWTDPANLFALHLLRPH